MSGGMRDKELSLRCRAVRWVRDHRAVLRLRTRPVGIVQRTHTHTYMKWIVYHPVARWAALVCIRCRQMITCSHFQFQLMHIKGTQYELVIFSVLNILYTFPPLTVTLTTDFKFSPVWLLPVGCLLGRHNCIHPPRVWRVIFFLGHSCTAGQIIYIKKTCAYGRFWQARFLKPLKNACMHPKKSGGFIEQHQKGVE